MQYCVVVLKRLWCKIPYLHIPAMILMSCVALGKMLYFSVPLFSYMRKGNINKVHQVIELIKLICAYKIFRMPGKVVIFQQVLAIIIITRG